MIQSFRCKQTEALFNRQVIRRIPVDLQRSALRKLKMINQIQTMLDLRVPPANRLEALKGAHKGQHSIRINDQRRICFRWGRGQAIDVEITDYHKG